MARRRGARVRSFGSHLASMDQTARNPGEPGPRSPPLAAATTRVRLDGSLLEGGRSAGRDAPRRARRRARAGGAAAKGEALMATRIRTIPGACGGRERARGARRNERGVDAFLLSKLQVALPTAGLLGPNLGGIQLGSGHRMPPLGTDGVGGDHPKGTIAMDDASTDEPRSAPSKTPSAEASPARDSDGATVPLNDEIADGDPASPIESAALRSRVTQLEAEVTEAGAMAANPSVVELAAARSRSISLEAELESARSDARKSEEAMGGMLRMQRAMSSAQKAKITQLREQNAQLEARIVHLNASLAEARAAADAERESREELRREAERFEARVNDAIESREAQWSAANARAVNEARAELDAAKELTRKMHVAHAAAKLRWAAERSHIVGSSVHSRPPSGPGHHAAVDSPLSLGGLAAARARSAVADSIPSRGERTHPRALAAEVAASPAPGTALHALLAATTRFSTDDSGRTGTTNKGRTKVGQTSDETKDEGTHAGDDDPLRELLRDAMEEEVAAAVERGYYRDGDDVVVGANDIVEAVVAKYSERGDDGDGTRGGGELKSAPLLKSAPSAHSGGDRGDGSPRDDDAERGAWRSERAFLVAELARARAAADAADARAALTAGPLHTSVTGVTGLERGHDFPVDDLAATYEAEEAKAVAALEIAAEVRANALEAELEALRRRAVSPARLRAVLGELRTLRAKLDALKRGCVMTQRLVRPTVESAVACLRLDAAEGARRGSPGDDAAAAGGGGGDGQTSDKRRTNIGDGGGGTNGGGDTTTPGFGPRTSTTPGARIAHVPPRTDDRTPRTPSGRIGGYPLASSSAAADTAGIRTEDLPETSRVAMDGLGFSNSLRKSAAVLAAEAEADAAKKALASAAKKALASIMDSPAGRNRRAG